MVWHKRVCKNNWKISSDTSLINVVYKHTGMDGSVPIIVVSTCQDHRKYALPQHSLCQCCKRHRPPITRIYQKYKLSQKNLLYASHTINVKADFDSLGFFTWKSWLNRLNSKMQKVNLKGLNEIRSKWEWPTLTHIKIITTANFT